MDNTRGAIKLKEKSVRHKRFLGVPLLVIIPILVVLLVSGGVIAAWAVAKDYPSSIMVLGGAGELYPSSDCVVGEELAEINFNSVWPGNTSSKTVFLKNKGDCGYQVYLSIEAPLSEGFVLERGVVLPVFPAESLVGPLHSGGVMPLPFSLTVPADIERGLEEFIVILHLVENP